MKGLKRNPAEKKAAYQSGQKLTRKGVKILLMYNYVEKDENE